jgi:hypothetical protein
MSSQQHQHRRKQQRKQQRERAKGAKEPATVDKNLEWERHLEDMCAIGRKRHADLEAVARYRAYVKEALGKNPDWLPEMGIPRELALTREQSELMDRVQQEMKEAEEASWRLPGLPRASSLMNQPVQLLVGLGSGPDRFVPRPCETVVDKRGRQITRYTDADGRVREIRHETDAETLMRR